MSPDEQLEIIKLIYCNSVYSGVGSNILESLDKALPTSPNWTDISSANGKKWRYEMTGVITEKSELDYLLDHEYWLANYSPGEIMVFHPSHHGGGGYKYILGDWADELGKKYDSWNYGVHKRRGEIA